MAGGGCEGAPHLNLLPWGEEVGGGLRAPMGLSQSPREGERFEGAPLRGALVERWSPRRGGGGPRRPPLGEHEGRPYGRGRRVSMAGGGCEGVFHGARPQSRPEGGRFKRGGRFPEGRG